MSLYAYWDDIVSYYANYASAYNGPYYDDAPNGSGYIVKSAEDVGISQFYNHVFLGWNTETDGSGDWYNATDDMGQLSGDAHLYAQWRAETFDVHYLHGVIWDWVEFGSGYTVKTLDETGLIVPEGKMFIGWNTDPDGNGRWYYPGDSIDDVAYHTETTYPSVILNAQFATIPPDPEIAYYANGGQGGPFVDTSPHGAAYEIRSNEAVGIYRFGYAFLGWNTEPAGTGQEYLPGHDLVPPDEGLDLYAQWAAGDVAVTYHPNGGEGSDRTDDARFGDGYVVKSVDWAGFSKPGETFLGWSADDGSGALYQAGDVIQISGLELNLYAEWGTSGATVTYHANGGQGGTYVDAVADGSGYDVRDPAEIGISWTGRIFLGWTTSGDGSGAEYLPGDHIDSVSGGIDLYAQWGQVIPPDDLAYEITVRRSEASHFGTVDGVYYVQVTNEGCDPTSDLHVTALIQGLDANGTWVSIAEVPVASSVILQPGETVTFEAPVRVSGGYSAFRAVTEATIDNFVGHIGVPYGPVKYDGLEGLSRTESEINADAVLSDSFSVPDGWRYEAAWFAGPWRVNGSASFLVAFSVAPTEEALPGYAVNAALLTLRDGTALEDEAEILLEVPRPASP